ncbi:alpha/beta hydrolase family esterase [Brasilonema sennae]|nr:PHB depolymerase family esterase [Brasilonema sennae]
MNVNISSQFLKRVFTCLLSISLVAGCESMQAQQITIQEENVVYGQSNGELADQGYTRTYDIYTPKSYSPSRPMPLVMVFHGDEGSGRSISNVSQFNKLADQKGFIVVYPDGIDQRWSIKNKNKRNIDDVSFVKNLINHIQEVRNIDSRRIYASGFSRGGILTQALSCELSDKIAAFASVAGSLPRRLKPNCQPEMPVSILMINGTNDQSVNYQGDKKTQKGSLVSIPEAIEFWRTHNQCPEYTAKNDTFLAGNQSDAPAGSRASRDRSKLKTYSYSGCSAGSEVVELAVVNGGHLWYGGSSTDKDVNDFNKDLGLDSTQTIWDFFERHTLPLV